MDDVHGDCHSLKLTRLQPLPSFAAAGEACYARRMIWSRLFTASFALVLMGWAASGHAADHRPPRTPAGVPDLQGTWTIRSLTRLVRPDELAGSPTAAQIAAFEAKTRAKYAAYDAPTAPDAPPPAAGSGLGNSEWLETGSGLARIGGQVRTSWIVLPADGKPPFNEAGRKAVKAADDRDDHNFDGPETRPTGERCLLAVGSNAGPPLANSNYNNLVQIVQTRDHVVILMEMNHDARIIRLVARPADRRHAPAQITPWMGDSIGWWERGTLVVETTNFNPGEKDRFNQSGRYLISGHAKVTERFTRAGPGEILYAFEVDDPDNYTQTWKGEIPLTATPERIYEYACHEGNYSLSNILAGARVAEQDKRVR